MNILLHNQRDSSCVCISRNRQSQQPDSMDSNTTCVNKCLCDSVDGDSDDDMDVDDDNGDNNDVVDAHLDVDVDYDLHLNVDYQLVYHLYYDVLVHYFCK